MTHLNLVSLHGSDSQLLPGSCFKLAKTCQFHLLPNGLGHQRVSSPKLAEQLLYLHYPWSPSHRLLPWCHGLVNDSNLTCSQDIAHPCMLLSPSVGHRSHCLCQTGPVLPVSISTRWCHRCSHCPHQVATCSLSPPLPGDVVAFVCQIHEGSHFFPTCMFPSFLLSQDACLIIVAVVRSAANSGFPVVYTSVHPH